MLPVRKVYMRRKIQIYSIGICIRILLRINNGKGIIFAGVFLGDHGLAVFQ